jgi:hypothetical protein
MLRCIEEVRSLSCISGVLDKRVSSTLETSFDYSTVAERLSLFISIIRRNVYTSIFMLSEP